MSKYNRELPLLCPVCGYDQFESTDETYPDPYEAPDEIKIKCADCGTVFSKEVLLHENSERINIALNELTEDFLNDAEKDFYKGW